MLELHPDLIAVSPRCLITAGWAGVLGGFLSGMAIGIASAEEAWAGGYAHPRRRFLRLGHIACTMLGIVSILAGLCVDGGFAVPGPARALFLTGLVTMPLCCVMTAYRPRARAGFPVPVAALVAAGALVLQANLA